MQCVNLSVQMGKVEGLDFTMSQLAMTRMIQPGRV
jgi:hypothetical protein